MTNLDKLESIVDACNKCPLVEMAQNKVFGEGNPEAKVMFVGEAPGREENACGRPFVGAAGKLLDKGLEKLGVSREMFYIANIVKCLVGTTRVTMADRSSMKIRDVVNSRHPGPVMSVDSDGKLVAAPIIGWHRSPLAGRSVVKLTHEYAKGNNNGTVGALLTSDHEVLTSDGWVCAGDVNGHLVATGGVKPSYKLRQLIYGSLLGDAGIPSCYPYLSEAHTAKQSHYLHRKVQLLGKLVSAVSEWTVTVKGKIHDVVGYRTHGDILFKTLVKEWYPRRAKVVPSYIETDLDWFGVAVWFMDDGHLRIRPNRQPYAEIATNAFSSADIDVLLRALCRLGLVAKHRRGRLLFDSENTARMCEKIASFVVPSMDYKLPQELRERFVPETWEDHEGWQTIYAPAHVSPAKSDAKTVFCIDVAGTHNFLTPGGIVHNCWPPRNRKPEKSESAACISYLEQQIEIIVPKVIVALGATAAQTMLEIHSSIGKIRGMVMAGPCSILTVPTWHPSYVLRLGGAGNKTRQKRAAKEFIEDLRLAFTLAGVECAEI